MTDRPSLVVTGHLGFIASAFCWNHRDEFAITGIDFAGWGALERNCAPGIVDVRADIADAPAIARALDEAQPTAIVNFAAESHVDRSIDDDLGFWSSNVMGARVLAKEALKRGIRLVHVSTDEVYGDALDNEEPWTESSPIVPKNPYSVTKAAAEMMLHAYHETDGLDVVVTRGANTIGARQYPEKAVPKAVTCFRRGTSFPLFRTPARRMWMHVDDHAAGVLVALRNGKSGEVYNLAPAAANEAYTHDVILKVRELVGQGDIQEVEDRRAYDLRYWMVADKAREQLGWSAKKDLETTLRDTVEWYLANPDWLDAANAQLRAATAE